MRTFGLTSIFLFSVLLVACGETVTPPPDGAGGSGAGGGATTTTSSDGGGGGAGGSGGGAGGGGAGGPCGGFAGLSCAETEVCVWADGSCGAGDGLGVCEPRPEDCPEDCPGVCGCDAQFYCNACTARQAGIDVLVGASCPMP